MGLPDLLAAAEYMAGVDTRPCDQDVSGDLADHITRGEFAAP